MKPAPVEDDSLPLDGLGARLREIRTAREMTLSELSLKSQVSVAMLSHIERGQSSPSLRTLERLRIALDVPLASFFALEAPPPENEDDVVVRAGRRSRLNFDKIGLVKELLSPPGHSDLEVLMLVIAPGGGSGSDAWTHTGEKAGLVLEGRFELTVGERVYRLEQGDSFRFDSSQPHWFRNLADGQSRVVWVIKSASPG
ncbi:MAG: helix-turn-helix domain-containing protein [Burkholderiaceae bacterium]